jgi:signal transduction histidine kinase
MNRLDRFLPERLRGAPDDVVSRARLGLTFAALTIVFFGTAGVLQFLAANAAAALFDLVAVALTVLGVLVARRTGRISLVVHVVLGLIGSAFISLSMTSRGAGLSGATLVISLVPLVATLVLGERAGLAWLAPALLAGLGLGVLGYLGLISNHLSGTALLLNDHLVLAIFTVALFALGALFDRRKEETFRQMTDLEALRREAGLRELRARVEAQLVQSEQFASLGRIAAATAHEINNPLAYLLGNLSFVKDHVAAADEDVNDALKESLEGAKRIQRIVADLTAMTRSSKDGLGEVVVVDALSTALSLAAPLTTPPARVRTTFAEVPVVTANEARLTQVLFNLLLNAAAGLTDSLAAAQEIEVTLSESDGQVHVEITDAGQARPTRGFDDLNLAVILGEAAVKSFGGTLRLDRRGTRSVARVSLMPASGKAQA